MKSAGRRTNLPVLVLLLSACAGLVPFALAAASPISAERVPPARTSQGQSGASAQSLLVVTNTDDSGPGSLRQAIAGAAAGGAITFAPEVTGTIALTSGQLVISTSLTLNGPGAGVLSVSGNHASRVLSITTGSSVSLSGLTIRGGYVQDSDTFGGGIKNSGTLTLTGAKVEGNQVVSVYGYPFAMGAGIYNEGTLSLINSSLIGNDTLDQCAGAGLVGGYGAGLENISTGVAVVISSTVSGNSNGGGIENGGKLTVIDSTVSANSGCGSGGIDNEGIMSVLNSTVSSNQGYVYHAGGTGGIFNYTSGTLAMTNTTVSDNGSNGVGGVYNWGVLTMTYSTVTNNSANTGYIGGGTGGIANSNVLALDDTLIANNTANGAASNCGSAMTSAGHNLSSDATCSLAAMGDLTNTNALLGPLQDNGGPALTRMPLFGSRAIDGGDNSRCPATDERGVLRPIDGDRDGMALCDIGAVEFNLTQTVVLPLVLH